MTTRDENIQGGKELAELLETLPVKMQKNINRAGLRSMASVLLDEVKRNVPVASGDLRNSVRITSRARGAQVSVSVKAGNAKAFYARMVEYGTKPHLVQVSDKDRGINSRTGKQISITTINRQQGERRSLQIGGNLVGPSVMHPGAKGRPFMRPAVDTALPRAIEAGTQKIRERLTKQGLNAPPPMTGDPEE
jgi:HK97 gp10 family phage protein